MVVVRFVDIGGIVYHHCINFFFHNKGKEIFQHTCTCNHQVILRGTVVKVVESDHKWLQAYMCHY